MEEKQKSGKGILLTIGWLTVALLTLNLMPPLLLFIPIAIGVVLKRDYQGGSALIICGSISGIVGWLLGMFVIHNFL
ncbi:hypothetical protein [Cytobacillus gottheilii]|uniref:hypothetical protein n=1 Tax=Cytobacillus gottheilii TaxID=859144 RepID=UPI0009BC152C|nr:hypothetical protein [Cytobacillus gottheilii]